MPRVVARPWTPAEDARLRQWVEGRESYKVIARRLGRSLRSAEGRAAALDIRHGVRAAAAGRRSRVAKLHAQGLCPADIACRLGSPFGTVYGDHTALGLRPHALPRADRGRRAVAGCRRANGRDLTGCRYLAEREAAAAAGWPAVSAGAVRHLDAFYRLGPATRREQAERVGVGRRAADDTVRGLADAGHLVVVGRRPSDAALRRRRKAEVYDLSPAVREGRRQSLALAGLIPD